MDKQKLAELFKATHPDHHEQWKEAYRAYAQALTVPELMYIRDNSYMRELFTIDRIRPQTEPIFRKDGENFTVDMETYFTSTYWDLSFAEVGDLDEVEEKVTQCTQVLVEAETAAGWRAIDAADSLRVGFAPSMRKLVSKLENSMEFDWKSYSPYGRLELTDVVICKEYKNIKKLRKEFPKVNFRVVPNPYSKYPVYGFDLSDGRSLMMPIHKEFEATADFSLLHKEKQGIVGHEVVGFTVLYPEVICVGEIEKE